MAFGAPAGVDPITYIPGQTPPVNTAPASALGSSANTYASYYPTPTAATGLATTATASKDSILAKTAAEADTLQAGQPAATSAISTLLAKLGGSSTSKVNAEDAAGLNTQQEDIDTLTSQMEARGKAYDDQITTLQQNNPNGELASGVSGDVNRLNQQKASELANIAIVLNAKTRNFTTLKSIVDAKADAETDDLKTQLQGLEYFQSQNSAQLSKDQQTILSDKIDSATKEYNDAKTNRAAVGNVQLEAAKNGAPLATITAIGNSEDEEAAIKAAGSYLQSKSGAGVFTNTQLNSGASNAGVSIGAFSSLTPDDQNYFVNGYSGFTAALKKVQSGDATPDDLKAAIDEAPISDAAKTILYGKAGIDPNAKASAPGFFSKAWDFITNL